MVDLVHFPTSTLLLEHATQKAPLTEPIDFLVSTNELNNESINKKKLDKVKLQKSTLVKEQPSTELFLEITKKQLEHDALPNIFTKALENAKNLAKKESQSPILFKDTKLKIKKESIEKVSVEQIKENIHVSKIKIDTLQRALDNNFSQLGENTYTLDFVNLTVATQEQNGDKKILFVSNNGISDKTKAKTFSNPKITSEEQDQNIKFLEKALRETDVVNIKNLELNQAGNEKKLKNIIHDYVFQMNGKIDQVVSALKRKLTEIKNNLIELKSQKEKIEFLGPRDINLDQEFFELTGEKPLTIDNEDGQVSKVLEPSSFDVDLPLILNFDIPANADSLDIDLPIDTGEDDNDVLEQPIDNTANEINFLVDEQQVYDLVTIKDGKNIIYHKIDLTQALIDSDFLGVANNSLISPQKDNDLIIKDYIEQALSKNNTIDIFEANISEPTSDLLTQSLENTSQALNEFNPNRVYLEIDEDKKIVSALVADVQFDSAEKPSVVISKYKFISFRELDFKTIENNIINFKFEKTLSTN